MKNLREEAKQKDISTNTLLNQIVKEHLNWHANASKAGFIAVRRLLITNLMLFVRATNCFCSRYDKIATLVIYFKVF
jgi:hypothetical protein